ncbi:C39 family peptidase [Tumebacillus lipolyticus]|uniref:C39 family peptidase n=1 Tax=Tumebacillus lipolyticus TaxID=1280370 RepID=A0ABW4ZTZ5_9BACL
MAILIEGIPVIYQYPILPTGCEATALTMLLRFAGLEIENTEVAHALPKVPLPRQVEGKMAGGNPNKGFVGDPFTKESFGVFHAPIAKLLDHYLPGRAVDLSAGTIEELFEVLEGGRPVIVWATLRLQAGQVTDVWYDEAGTEVQWISPQHCMLMVGYDQEHVILNDPDTGNRELYPRDLFVKRWELLGRQAVTVKE